VIDGVLDRLAEEAAGFVARSTAKGGPFFLYAALTGPHKPTQPHKRFRGRTALGEYGDFVFQVDWTVGRILRAIDEAGVGEDTLVVYTSDNGSYMYSYDDSVASDHVTDPTRQGYFPRHHRANGLLRGTKADIWEAGHRVPLFVRWPGTVAPGSRSAATVCLTDLFATCVDVVGQDFPDGAAEDSYSLLPKLLGKKSERGAPVIHHSANGMFAVRSGRWKLILGNGSGGRENPKGEPFKQPYRLFDLSQDLAESQDVAAQHPEIVKRLTEELEALRRPSQ
jgi:arylsulfatase A-like enzyme